MIGIRGAFYSVIALGFARRLLGKLMITPGRPDKGSLEIKNRKFIRS